MRRITNNYVDLFMPIGIVTVSCLAFVLVMFYGPHCLAYDINMINKYFENKSRPVSMWEPPIFICGIIFSELAIPVSFGIWLFHSVGAM